MTKAAAWLLALLAAVACAGIFDRDLWTPDEPRDAAVAAEMSRTGALVVPHLAGEPFVEKPPLYFAVAAGSLRALGPVAGAAGAIRFTSVLFGLGTLAATWLLARRLYGSIAALATTIVLGTMVGFVANTHWIRVDIALACFVTAAIATAAEAVLAGRPWCFVPAGLSVAGAFLTKGPIGLVVIAVAGLPFAVARALARRRGASGEPAPGIPWIWVLAGLLAAVVPAGLWIVRFRAIAGPELWHDWLWVNQLGRFGGDTPALGHLKRDEPFYYLATLVVYTLPWTPLVAVWLGDFARDLRARKLVPPARVLLASWGFGTLILLSLSITKRDIYLLPALPAFAIACGERVAAGLPKWCRRVFDVWMALALTSIGALAALPFFAGLRELAPERAAVLLAPFSARHLAALAIALVAALSLLRRRNRISIAERVAGATALLFLSLLILPAAALDAEKRLGPEVREFAARFPAEARPSIAGVDFSETLLGAFSFYASWPVPQIRDASRVASILEGHDPSVTSLLVADERDGEPALEGRLGRPLVRLAESSFGSAGGRRITWIAGPAVAESLRRPPPAQP